METWFQDSHLCTVCDALIEVTRKDEFRNIWHCGVECILLSVEDATIHPNNERKEMESTEYNPNQLVTYKKIHDGIVSYETVKMNTLEYDLAQYRALQDTDRKNRSMMNNLEENIIEWYNPNYDKDEVLAALCDLIGFTPVKKVTVNATVALEVVVEVPADQVEDFDAQQALNDYLAIDYTDGGYVNSHYVEDVDVEW